jgi:hypothetical protein
MATVKRGADGLGQRREGERRAVESLYPRHGAPKSQPIPQGIDLAALEAEIRGTDSLDSSERLRLLAYVRELVLFHLAHRGARP